MEKQLYFATRDKWRDWLKTRHLKEREAWLVYYTKLSGKPGISYDESVEEAICFGWIDNRVKGVDAKKFIRRFVPRRSAGSWSKFNIARAQKMIDEGKMTEAGLAMLPEGLAKGKPKPLTKQD